MSPNAKGNSRKNKLNEGWITFRNVTYYSIDLTEKNILRIDLMSAGISDIFEM